MIQGGHDDDLSNVQSNSFRAFFLVKAEEGAAGFRPAPCSFDLSFVLNCEVFKRDWANERGSLRTRS